MDVGCIEAVKEGIARYRKPEVFNTDQGSLLGLNPGIMSMTFTAC